MEHLASVAALVKHERCACAPQRRTRARLLTQAGNNRSLAAALRALDGMIRYREAQNLLLGSARPSARINALHTMLPIWPNPVSYVALRREAPALRPSHPLTSLPTTTWCMP